MLYNYGNQHGSHQYTPFMLAYIPAPWIRHGIYFTSVLQQQMIRFLPRNLAAASPKPRS